MTTQKVTVTRCPKCQTQFRVTSSQLHVATGSVRCGSCLHVFNALKSIDTVSPTVSIEIKKEPAPHIQTEKSSDKNTQEKAGEQGKKNDLHSMLNTLDKEQVVIPQAQERKRKKTDKKRLFNVSLVLAGCLALFLQYAWFNLSELSLKPELRSLYKQLCQVADCSLPPLVDISQIQSSQLLVRVDPDNTQRLIVDAVIINKASHPQPWPLLSLAFADLQDQPVASRTFYPREYLGGELAGSREMPANKPVRLSLELLDPGIDAVNYRLTLKNNTH